MLKENASLRDVIKCLENWEVRHRFIDMIPKELQGILDDEICALCELDEKETKGDDKGEIIGTRLSKIDGIQHRINLLKKDLKLKMMFNKTTESNIDLVKAMDKGKVVLIKMPQSAFPSPYARNVVVTYFFTKIWSSTLVRGDIYDKPKRVHLIVDELFQSPTAMQLLKDQEWLPQTRKFGLRSVFSCQYLGQMDIINQTLKSAGASYMLLKGSGSNTYNEFKDVLPPYTIDDLEALPQYHSLNIISYEKGRAKFITKLPSIR